jgi:hypothetical protein
MSLSQLPCFDELRCAEVVFPGFSRFLDSSTILGVHEFTVNLAGFHVMVLEGCKF